MNKNFMVLMYENGYPNKNGIATLIGIYATKGEAQFISTAVKERNKLTFYPTIEPTDFPVTTTKVGDYLKRKDEEAKEKAKKTGHGTNKASEV